MWPASKSSSLKRSNSGGSASRRCATWRWRPGRKRCPAARLAHGPLVQDASAFPKREYKGAHAQAGFRGSRRFNFGSRARTGNRRDRPIRWRRRLPQLRSRRDQYRDQLGAQHALPGRGTRHGALPRPDSSAVQDAWRVSLPSRLGRSVRRAMALRERRARLSLRFWRLTPSARGRRVTGRRPRQWVRSASGRDRSRASRGTGRDRRANRRPPAG